MEMVLVMPVISMLTMIAIGWIGYTMKFANRVKRQREHHTSVNRLAGELREDVSAAETAEISEPGLLTLTSNASTIRYKIESNRVLLEETLTDNSIKREQFRFHSSAEVSWDSKRMPEAIGLQVYRKSDVGASSSRRLFDFVSWFRVGRWQGLSEVKP